MENLPIGMLAALVGLIGGAVLGLSARLGDFCTLGALESAAYGEDQRRLRLWGVVLAVAITGAFLAEALGWADITPQFLSHDPVVAAGLDRGRADVWLWHGAGGQLRLWRAGALWRR